ncbi:MAG TPA: aryl-sulfate sulfotransferase [Terriglobales bacterium]|nr:aryl-sulfate sulfotransferase [Terriglobales bacterium]
MKTRGYAQNLGGGARPDVLTVPVYGLYSGYSNQVLLNLVYWDGTSQSVSLAISTPTYTDRTGLYATPIIIKRRSPNAALGFSFFVIKSALGSPVVVDTDGEIRWVGSGVSNSISTFVVSDGFIVGDAGAPIVHYLGLDGTVRQSPLQFPGVTSFHHNVDLGKQGYIAEVITGPNVESIASEITSEGRVLKTWDLGSILSTYMQANGDDPSTFVRPGVDWFHMNAVAYDPSDDSLIVSSRENFLIKLDYKTGDIKWIFGDPTKYWYTFPSLRAKAVILQGGGLYPIGQHAVSITSEGFLMVFNDGLGSGNQPVGEPAGQSLTYSTVSAYSVDSNTLTARDVWDFDYGQSIYSRVCSSAYEAPSKSYLIDYAVADNMTAARLVGLDSSHNVVFDFQYPNASGCNTSWNAVPIPLDDMQVMQ